MTRFRLSFSCLVSLWEDKPTGKVVDVFPQGKVLWLRKACPRACLRRKHMMKRVTLSTTAIRALALSPVLLCLMGTILQVGTSRSSSQIDNENNGYELKQGKHPNELSFLLLAAPTGIASVQRELSCGPGSSDGKVSQALISGKTTYPKSVLVPGRRCRCVLQSVFS